MKRNIDWISPEKREELSGGPQRGKKDFQRETDRARQGPQATVILKMPSRRRERGGRTEKEGDSDQGGKEPESNDSKVEQERKIQSLRKRKINGGTQKKGLHWNGVSGNGWLVTTSPARFREVYKPNP